MSSRRIILGVSAFALAALLAVSGCGSDADGGSPGGGGGSVDATAPADSAGLRELILDRCTKCHTADRIRRAEHDEAQWLDTIGRMRSRGANVNDAEAGAIAEYLAGGGGSEL